MRRRQTFFPFTSVPVTQAFPVVFRVFRVPELDSTAANAFLGRSNLSTPSSFY